jgi:hypothetical protein
VYVLDHVDTMILSHSLSLEMYRAYFVGISYTVCSYGIRQNMGLSLWSSAVNSIDLGSCMATVGWIHTLDRRKVFGSSGRGHNLDKLYNI